MGCLIDAGFEMIVDVMQQTTVQDPDSGAIKRTWKVVTTDIPATAKSIVSTGYTNNGEKWGEVYQNPGWTRMATPARSGITDRSRITNIRLKDTKELIWKEPSGDPTVFEVVGVTPVTAVFVGYYQDAVLLQRAEVQDA